MAIIAGAPGGKTLLNLSFLMGQIPQPWRNAAPKLPFSPWSFPGCCSAPAPELTTLSLLRGRVRALSISSQSTAHRPYQVSCWPLVVESLTLRGGVETSPSPSELRELPLPPALRHPGLHPPGQLATPSLWPWSRLTFPTLSLHRLTHQLRDHLPSLQSLLQEDSYVPSPLPQALPRPLLTPAALDPLPELCGDCSTGLCH